MAKRFTDTDKWKKPFIKSLPSEYKLFWLFLLDECDHAGIWHIELEIAEARLGIKLSIERIRGLFGKRVVEFDNGTKLFLPDFIEFQYGRLKENNNAHKSVIDRICKYGLQGHLSPSRGALDKDKEQEKDKEPLGIEFVKTIARKVWDSQGWREQACMGLSIQPKDLQKWMALFNSSVSNDHIPNFDEGAYKKMIRGWISKQIEKGYKVDSGPKPEGPIYQTIGQ